MRRSTFLLASEAVLVAAMLERMGWVNWLAAIHVALCVALVVSVGVIYLLIAVAIFIVLPCLVLIGIGKAVVWLFRPATLGDAA